MQYRQFGKRIDFKPSALGFGTMRLPTIGGDDAVIDEAKATDMLRTAIDNGLNYVDTAWPYHGGNSETWLGRALADGYREKVKIANKLPTWAIQKASDFDEYLDKQLEKLKIDCFDFYLLHTLQEKFWPPVRDLGACDWLLKARDDGRIKHLGFSFHGQLPLLMELIDGFDQWDFCQVQYNFMNERVQAGTQGVKYAAEKGLGVIVMEPLLGGCLANPPQVVKDVWETAAKPVDPVAAALNWLWHKPEVSLVLSGMSTLDQVTHNLKLADASSVGMLNKEDLALIREARDAYNSLETIPCTKCRYCMPCPSGVDIPGNFECYNNAVTFGGVNFELNKNLYSFQQEERKAASCVACGECEVKCPQHIKISRWMPKVHEKLTQA